jgi:ADP-ribose pyrophosphatase YjhB (NUDIX family)
MPGLPIVAPSRHLLWLRERVPEGRLFAPRVALALRGGDGDLLAGEDGTLPACDLELESSIEETAERLLAGLPSGGPGPAQPLHLIAVQTGADWFEEHPELGPLQPIWIVLGTDPDHASPLAASPTGALAPSAAPAPTVSPALALPSAVDPALDPALASAGDYIRHLRARIGRERIFYPWAGVALRDPAGRVFLVRLAQGAQWHCPGGGLEIGEAPATTASRELEEETGLEARPTRLVGCFSRHLRAFANGDRIQGIAILLEAELTGGSVRPDRTGEIDAHGWFSADDLPPLDEHWEGHVRLVLSGSGPRFD